jgi:kynurenine formamidase
VRSGTNLLTSADPCPAGGDIVAAMSAAGIHGIGAGLPTYDGLLARTDAPAGSSWGLWGADDRLGCLNLLTPETALRGIGSVVDGRTIPLDLDLSLPDPPLFGRRAYRHDVVWLRSNRGHDETLSDWNPQSSSQWDGFRHIRSPVHGFYNGIADEDHGVQHWAQRGVVTRGVLADVAAWRRAQGRPIDPSAPDAIEPEDLSACLEAAGVAVEPGDILLVRTGWLTWYRTLDAAARRDVAARLVTCGLRPGRPSARWLWDHRVAAVAADNPGLEVMQPILALSPDDRRRLAEDPGACDELLLHFALLPLLGMPIGELWDLDALAEACAADGRYAFLLTSAPMHLRHGVGSPPNALAVR